MSFLVQADGEGVGVGGGAGAVVPLVVVEDIDPYAQFPDPKDNNKVRLWAMSTSIWHNYDTHLTPV